MQRYGSEKVTSAGPPRPVLCGTGWPVPSRTLRRSCSGRVAAAAGVATIALGRNTGNQVQGGRAHASRHRQLSGVPSGLPLAGGRVLAYPQNRPAGWPQFERGHWPSVAADVRATQ
jgi:hypothetical protein